MHTKDKSKAIDYSRIMKSLHHGALQVNSGGHIQHANAEIADLLEMAIDDIENKLIFELAPEINLLEWKKYIGKLQDEGSIEFETHLLTASENLLKIHLKAILIENDECLLTIRQSIDSDRFKELLKLAAQAGGIVGWEWNIPEQSITFSGWIDRIPEIKDRQISEPEVVELCRKKLHRAEFAALLRNLKMAATDGRAFHMEFLLSREEGGKQRLFLDAIPVGSDLQITRVFGILRHNLVS
ncbi:MAG: hypothetical protein R3350_07880, partial [Saprospiraceae bacterium]|nr:hypothetical protein [Saprospiraceae bacterium]